MDPTRLTVSSSGEGGLRGTKGKHKRRTDNKKKLRLAALMHVAPAPPLQVLVQVC